MGVFGHERQLCPYYKERQEFQKLVELNDSSLVIYCYRTRTEDIRQDEALESTVNICQDMFILHNKKDVKITTSELRTELEKENISCPRCRKIFEHAQELMKEVKSIDGKNVMGICDHCLKKARGSKLTFCACDRIAKKFISGKVEQNEDAKKYVKTLPSEMGHLLQDTMRNKQKQKKTSAYSDLQINTTAPHTSLANSETNFLGTYVGDKELPRFSLKDLKQEEILDESPSMDAKEALKRRHDLSLRQMMRVEKDSEVPYSVSKRVEIYETPKITSKSHVKSKIDLKITTPTKTKHDLGPRATRDRDYTSNSQVSKSSTTSQKNEKSDKYDSEERSKKVKKLDDRYITDEELKGSIKTAGKGLQSQFMFIFPKGKEKQKSQPKLDEMSSVLIKDTKEKLRLQAEEEMKRKEQEHQQKLEQGQKRKLAREEKKHLESKNDGKHISESKLKVSIDTKKDDDKVTKKGEKDKPEKPELKSTDDDQISKAMKDQGGESKDKDKIRQGKKEDDALNKQAAKEKSTKKTQDEIKESKRLSKLQKSTMLEKKQTSREKGGKKKESEHKTLKLQSTLSQKHLAEFQKLRAELLKEKSAANQAKQEAKKEAKEEEVKMKNIRLIKKDKSLEISNLFQIKQAAKIKPLGPNVVKGHACNHMPSGRKRQNCPLCQNSDLELEYLDNKINQRYGSDIIIGENIFKQKPCLEKTKKPEVVPILFQTDFCIESDQNRQTETTPAPARKQILNTKEIEVEPDKRGIVRYALSDRTFIDKGWTMLPTEKIVQKMNVYRMRPAHPEFDWFEHNKNKRLITYDSGERLAEFDDNGRGRWYYRNGRLALDYYDAEETNAQQRFVIYSSGERDERGRSHPITILATFDYLGNGIVFDHAGKIRIKYNQTEGVVLDRGIGPVSHWKWHSLNDPPVLQQVMIDTQMAHKDPYIINLGSPADTKTRPDNEEMLAIEFDNFIKEKNKKLSQKFKPFQIKMKALKINEHFSLRVLDQATVYLIFRDGSTNLKLNIGMILDHQEIVDTDSAEVGKVSNSLERFPARTDSLAGLQRSVAHAQHYEKQHVKRERWLQLPEPCASADQMTAAASPPLRHPLRTVPTGSSSSAVYCSRKPTNNVYYDTRFL